MSNKLAPNIEQDVRRTIRDAYAIDPLLSSLKLVKLLSDRYNRSFSWVYVNKLKHKAMAEATPNLDRVKTMDRLRETNELLRMGKEHLLKIAYGQPVNGLIADLKEQTGAWRAIAFLEKLRISTEVELGLFNQPVDSSLIDNFRWRAIPDDVRGQMLASARLWKMPEVLTRRIEIGQIVDAESRDVPPVAPVAAPAAPQKPAEPAKPSHGIQPDPELQLS